jgi:hypothetical protein
MKSILKTTLASFVLFTFMSEAQSAPVKSNANNDKTATSTNSAVTTASPVTTTTVPTRVEHPSKPVIIDPVPVQPVVVQTKPKAPGAWDVILGMNSGAGNIGADYETMKSDSTGIAPYFLHSGKEGSIKTTQASHLGFSFKAHLYPGFWDLYAAPGLGITQAEVPSTTSSSSSIKSVIGPTFRWGALYRTSSKFAIGLENFNSTNWLDKEISGSYSYTNLILRFEVQ